MDDSTANQRAKRQRIDKTGRFAALERLKNLKGSKNKYEVGEIDNVYDEVDEREYAKRVMARADEDWIEDDGTGYVEDGREIFDDVESDEEEVPNKAKKRKSDSSETRSKKKLRDVNKPVEGNGSIRKMFGKGQTKKENQVKLDDDDILAGILGEIGPESQANGTAGTSASTSTSSAASASNQSRKSINTKTEMAIVKEYMQNFTKTVQKKTEMKPTKTNDDELLDRILQQKVKPNQAPAPKIDKERIEKTVEEKENNTPNDLVIDEEEIKDEKADDSLAEVDEMDYSILDDDENQFNESDINGKTEILKKEIAEKETKIYENILSNWENVCHDENEADDELLGSIDVGEVSNDNVLRFWFWDAWEDAIKFPGKIFLFGRMKSDTNPKEFKSVCITVENVQRNLFVLPREYVFSPASEVSSTEKVTFTDVYKELSKTLQHDFKCKKVEKHFAFHVPNVNVPATTEYFNVRYDGKYPPMNTKKVYATIEHIFGTNTPSLETFLLDCKIKGPCWLNVTNYEKSKMQQSTWCDAAFVCQKSSSISVSNENKNVPPPPLSVVTINVRTALHPKTHTNEIVMIVCLVNNKFPIDKRPPNPPFTKHFCGLTHSSSQNWPIGSNEAISKFKPTKITKVDSERTLLSWFLTTFKSIDPDLIVTHDANDCQLDIICDRISALKLPMWSRIGRLNLSALPKRYVASNYFVGRMICDVKVSAEECVKSRSYDLDTLCQTVLNIKENERMDVSNDELFEMYESSDGILRLVTLTLQDSLFIMRMMCEMNVLPLALQITNICGNLMNRTLNGGRSERNEYLLLHAFTEKDYIVPDKRIKESNWSQTQDQALDQTQTNDGNTTEATSSRKKPTYSGGLVLDPIKGFYEKFILLMDFNSLYPSIIQEYNICFTTIDIPETDDAVAEIPDPNLEQGVLPRQIRNLVERRREVKKLMVAGLEPELKNQYNIRQTALKLTANSMYGCLGFAYSRFFAKHLAALVTQKGREILMNTKDIVTKMNYEVVYGDTDSIMINTHSTDFDEVYKIGSNIKQSVNKIYRQVELDIDGVFKCMLLLNKKKYAAVTISKSKAGQLQFNVEKKGLDIVRRDWSQISVMAGGLVLDHLFTDLPLDERIDKIHASLEHIRDNINNNKVPLSMMTITRQLTKAPKEYVKTLSLPHVQVANRMNATRNKRYKKGDMVSYVICEDGTNEVPTQRAYHLDEMKGNSKLKIDKEYYLANQIYPVVSRLLKPIEATNSAHIAQCLGLDPNKYKESGPRHTYESGQSELIGESILQSNAVKYRECTKFSFKCIACGTENVIAKPFNKIDNQMVPVLQYCANRECKMPPYQQLTNIYNHLTLAVRSAIRRYYENWLVCDEPHCNQQTRTFSHVTDEKNRPICMTCKQGRLLKSFTEGDLYKQLRYFQFMFELPRYDQTLLRTSPEIEDTFKILREYVERILVKSDYQYIHLSDLFKKLHPNVLMLNHASQGHYYSV